MNAIVETIDMDDLAARVIDSRRLFTAWIVLCCIVGGAVQIYLLAGLAGSGGLIPVMPLDDVYIHFQYARTLAEGHPFQYNPGQPPTSGATSLLYPAILAVGYLFGFQEIRLAWWALAVGALCWLGSTWLVYRISKRGHDTTSHWIALANAVAFALTGSLGWAFMSGMETALMIFATLLTLWYVVCEDRRGVAVTGTLAGLIRPEGLAIGLLAVIYMALHERSRRDLIRHFPLYALPLLAAMVQPTLNLLLTGSLTASGMQAKSYLYNVPSDLGIMLRNIVNRAVMVWVQLSTGIDEDGVRYIVPGMLLIGLASSGLSLRIFWRERVKSGRVSDPPLQDRFVVREGLGDSTHTHALHDLEENIQSDNSPSLRAERGLGGEVPRVALLVVAWLLALTAAVSILETAFWQVKRYQQPMIALLFPLVAWFLTASGQSRVSRIAQAVIGVLLVFSLISTADFVRHYFENVHEIASSQIPMARYVAQTLPPGAVVGVHDIGVMRYLGKHPTYDVVGLTTPGAAKAFRNGPGAEYEQMLHSPWRPDYFAIYPDARGLTYFDSTGLFRETLATFPSTQPTRNVASATNSGQSVYKADWTYSQYAGQPWQPPSLKAVEGMKLVDSVNVADLASEDAHQYRWWEAAHRPGFATEVYELSYVSCQPLVQNPTCKVLDGGRLITGGEEMTIGTQPGQDLVWITRVHPRNDATLGIFVDGKRIATRVIPAIPGQWLEIATLIPGNMITGTQTRVRAEANISDPNVGHYMPYYHWYYQGKYQPDATVTLPGPGATFGQSILLMGHRLTYNPSTRTAMIDLEWQIKDSANPGSLGDAKLFVHLYDQNDKFVEGAQIDVRLGNGVLPPANWLPGILRESYTLTVPDSVPSGTYRVAIGLYDPAMLERLPVTGEGVGSDRRLFIGTIDVR
jgi:hypothetical protein